MPKHKFPFPDKGPSKRECGWTISAELKAYNEYGESEPAQASKEVPCGLELKPPKSFSASANLNGLIHWEPPVNVIV